LATKLPIFSLLKCASSLEDERRASALVTTIGGLMRKRWLVAGGLGFIGSAFVRMVIQTRPDIDVVVYDIMSYAGNPANVAVVADNPRYSFVRGDIADEKGLDDAVGSGVDAIVNFAAETHVDRSIHDSAAFLRTGVMGVHALLEVTRRHRVPRFLQVSTDEVYGDIDNGHSLEADPLRPRSPYATAKAAGDLLALAFFTTFDVPAIVTRGSNTYGPYQYPEKLVPLFVTNLVEGQTVPIYGDGLQVRDWLHVDDHARGVLHVLENGELGNVYNIGGGNGRTNIEMTEAIIRLLGKDWDTCVRHVRDREGHDRRYAVDTSKARSLGWAPQVDFIEGLAQTVSWYCENEAWWRPIKSGDFRAYYERQYATR
jgi:dTDP-glucose 4,6-dehydratase